MPKAKDGGRERLPLSLTFGEPAPLTRGAKGRCATVRGGVRAPRPTKGQGVRRFPVSIPPPLRGTSLYTREAWVRGVQRVRCAGRCGHRPLRQDRGRAATFVGAGACRQPAETGRRKRRPLQVLGRVACGVVGRPALRPPSTYDSTPIDAAG